MHLTPLDDSKILIGKAVDQQDQGVEPIPIRNIANGAFTNNCPLWTYILAEAAQNQTAVAIPATGGPDKITTPQLGPVGGRIVAEVILGLMFGDGWSILSRDPHWKPVTGQDFRLRNIVAYALGQGPALH